LAYRSGVTVGITAPSHSKFYGGLGTAFSLGAAHKLEKGAVVQEITAVHVSIRHFSKPSVSTQVAALRRLLLGPSEGEAGIWFDKVKSVCPPFAFNKIQFAEPICRAKSHSSSRLIVLTSLPHL